jgi:nucleoside-triphosphatase
MGRAILLTGNPGCGKTTLIKHILELYPDPCGGFFTQELRQARQRVGFEIVTLDGRRGLLAHVNIRSSIKVGKYKVDLTALNEIGVAEIDRAIDENKLVVIDEIGPMEIYSPIFRQAVTRALRNRANILGTVVKRSTPFTDAIKREPGVVLIEVRPDNRVDLVDIILGLLLEN